MGQGKRVPSYRRHSSGQARVTIRGRDILLGPWDSEQSRQAYARVVAEYLANQGTVSVPRASTEVCAGELIADYLVHIKHYHGDTTERENIKRALAPVAKLYAELPANEFGPVQFKAVRADWTHKSVEIDTLADDSKPQKARSRGYVNSQMARVLRFLKWCVGEGKLPSSVYEACKCVEPLKRGKCDLEDTPPVEAVPIELVNATVKHLTKVLAAMVKFQLATACRPGELVRLTPGMVDRSGEVWIIRLTEHKTASRGKQRVIYVGPKAQAILKPYLLRGSDVPCFSPLESEKQRRGKYKRRTKRPDRPIGNAYDTSSYGKAIKYACKRAKLQHWSPNQLRHTAATIIRKQFGLEAAQVILGHSELSVTQVYAEADQEKAIEIARKIG